MTPDEARQGLAVMLEDWVLDARLQEVLRTAIATIDRAADLKRKHDEVNATNGHLAATHGYLVRRHYWLVRYAWKQRCLLKEGHAWVRKLCDEIEDLRRQKPEPIISSDAADELLRARLNRIHELSHQNDQLRRNADHHVTNVRALAQRISYLTDKWDEEKKKVDALLRANARLEGLLGAPSGDEADYASYTEWRDESVLTEDGIRFARPVPDSELRGAVVHLVDTSHPGDGLPVRPNRVLVNGQDVGLMKDPPKVDAGGKELTTVTLVLLPSKVIIGDATSGDAA